MSSNTGIEYFPFDVNFFDDNKIALIESEFGIKGSIIAIRLLCKIYSGAGYYYQWGNDECLIFARKSGVGIVPNTVQEIINGLVRRSFFDKGVYDKFNVLTSHGIQRRFFEAVKRRQIVEVRRELLLVDVSRFNNVRFTNEMEHKIKHVSEKSAKGLSTSSGDTLSGEISHLRNSLVWLETVAMRFRISVSQVNGYLNDFELDCRSRGTLNHNSLNDTQRHFNDWLRIQINNNNTSDNGNYRKTDRRRANKEIAAKTEDFKSTF